MIEGWLREGMSVEEIALKWNQGNTSKCSSGTNSFGVKYDSCEYVALVIKNY